MFYWADPLTPATERSLELADVRVEVYQSNISELTSENSSLTSEFVSFPNNELGNFVINFTAERGFADAYDVRICQDLPIGVVFDSELGSGYDDHGCGSAYVAPSSGDSGTICWEIDQVCNTNSDSNNMNTITYRLLFSSAALSGWYAPRTYVAEYTSLPGTVDGERYYSEFDYYNNDADFEDVLMETDCSAGADCPFEIVGWGLNKDVNPEVVSPGEVLVYTISYSNTSSTNAYTSFMITDTYDALLTVVSAPNAAHDPVNRTLVWDIDNLSAPTSRTDITFSAQVDSVISGVYGLSNRVDATADGVLPTFYTLDTDIKVALLDVALSSPVTWTHAAGVVTYTVTYTNTGSAEKPYTLTFAYDPYLSYGGILYTDGAVRVSDAVFTDSVPANTTRVLEVTTTVAHPLPYDLESLTSSVTVESPGAEAATDELEVLLKRPQFGVFEKTSFESFVPTGGSSIRYNVEITNTGDYIATNCVITDTWDAGQMSFDDFGSPDWSSPGAGTALWDSNPFTLTPGSGVRTTRLTLNIEATVPYYENHVDIVCDQVDQVPTERHVLQSASLQTTKTASDEIAFPDRVLTYTILYTNTNVNSAIVNAVITDVLPSGFSLIDYTKSDQLSGCQFGEGDGTVGDPVTHVYWTCDSLLAGATGTLQVWGMVVEPEGGTLTNRTETDGAGIPFREGDVVVVLPATRPKLALTQTLSSPYVYVAPGDLVTYTLLYQNHGTARADDVQVAIELPSRVSYVSGGTLNGDVVEWSLGSVDAGAEDTLTLVVEAGTVLGEVSFVGFQKISSQRLTWDDAETIYAAEDVIEIKSPSLALVKTVEPRTASYGDVITFTVVFSNNGGGVLTGVMLEDMFNNQYVTYNGASAVECVDTINGDVTEVVCDGFGDFIPEQERTIEFYVVDDIPNTTTDQTITNTATIDSDQTNPLTSNEVLAVHNPTCTPLTGVTLAQPSSSSIEIGESATFTATVEPSGAGTPYNYKAIYDDGTTQTTQTGTASSSPFTWSSPFNTVGNYTVTVAVWNCWLYESEALMSNDVSLTVTEMCYETVDPSFTYAPQNPTAGDTVYFTGTVTGTMPITYYWNFGEGPVVEQSGITSTSTIMIPTSVMHTFTMSNTYTVIMTATNACGVDVSYAMDVPVSSGETFIYLPLVLKNQS